MREVARASGFKTITYGNHMLNGVDDSRHYETISSCSPNCLLSNEKSSCRPESLGFSPSSSISLSQSTALDKRKTGGNYYERGHGEIRAKVSVWNITSTIHENEDKTLLTNIVDTTKLVESGDQVKVEEPLGECVLPKELKIIPDRSISSHTVLTDQRNAILSNEDPISQAIRAGFSPSCRESTFTSLNETDKSLDKNDLTLLNSCSVGMNAGMLKCPIPQVTELLPSDKEINSAPKRNVEKSRQLMDHSGNCDKAVVCTSPIGSEGNIQEQNSKEGSTVQIHDSNALKRKCNYKRSLMPLFSGIVRSNTDRKNVRETSSDHPTVLGSKTIKRLKILKDTTVLYLPPDEASGEVDSEPELVICLSPESEILNEDYQIVVDIPYSKYPKLIPSKRARSIRQKGKHDAPRVLNSELLHGSVNDRIPKLIPLKRARPLRQMGKHGAPRVLNSDLLHGSINDRIPKLIPSKTARPLCQMGKHGSPRVLNSDLLHDSVNDRIPELIPSEAQPLRQMGKHGSPRVLNSDLLHDSVNDRIPKLIPSEAQPLRQMGKHGSPRVLNSDLLHDSVNDRIPKLIPSEAQPLRQMGKDGAPRVLNSDVLHDSVNDRIPQLNNRSTGQADEIGNGRNSLDDKIATFTSLNVNPSQQVNGDQTVSDFLKRSCRIDSKKADKFINVQKSSLGFPNQQMKNQNHGQQVVEKCTFPSVCLTEDENEKRVDGIFLGDNGGFYQKSKSRQAAEHIPLNMDIPSNVDEKATESVSTQLSHHTVCSDGNLEYPMNSEPKMRSLCSSDRFNEEGNYSIPSLKTVSTRHQSQSMDIERVVENISPARLKSKSTKVSGQLAESTVCTVKGQNIANLSPRDKRPHQPDNPEPTVKRSLSLEGKQLHEIIHETDSDRASAANNLQAVRSPHAECTVGTVKGQNIANLSPRDKCPHKPDNPEPIVKRSLSLDSKRLHEIIHETVSDGASATNYLQAVRCPLPECTVSTVKGQNMANLSPRDKRPHQPDNPEPTMKRGLPLEGKQLHEINHETVTDGASATNDLQAVRCSLAECTVGTVIGQNIANLSPRDKRAHQPDNPEPIVKRSLSLDGKRLHEIIHETVSDGASATNDLQAVGCPLAERTVGSVKGQNIANLYPRDKLPHQQDNPEPTVKRGLSLEGKQLHEINHETVSDGASATNGLQAIRCPSNVNEKFAMPTSTTTQSSPQTTCSDGNLKNLMDSEPTVRFVWSSDWFNKARERKDTVPSIKTVSTRQQEAKQLHETNVNKTDLYGTSATNDFQNVRCIFPDEWKSISSTRSENRQGTCPDECNTLTSVQLVSRRIAPPGISLDSQFEEDGSKQDMIPESSMPKTRCLLPCDELDENDVRHIEHCETIAYALDLRMKQSSVFQSLPNKSMALDLVNKIIGCVCKQYLLDNMCMNDHCSLVHNVQFNFDLPGHDFKIFFNVFSKWYLSNSKQPNLKVLLQLLSLLSRDFGDELLITILCISTALLQVAQNFRRPLGIKLIEKLVHLVDFTKKNAIRTIIIFNLTPDTEEAIITDLLHSLGVYEEDMTSLYESISCIWHINGNYSFSQNVLFAMLKECVQEMPPKFDVTKKKIIDELLKYPRSVLNKHFHVIERLLLKYFALNSLAAHKVRCIVYYGKIPKPEGDTTRTKSYQSSRVKGTGPINWNWEYLDLNEQSRKSFELSMYKMVQDEDQTEEVCAPVELSTAPDFKMEELLDGTDVSDNLKLLETLSNDSTVDSSKYIGRMEKALKRRKYKRLIHIVMKSAEGKSLDTYMNELYDMLTRQDERELPRTVYECLKLMPQSQFHKTPSLIRNKFTVVINSLVLMFYKNRDFKSALKLLKTLRMSGVNPLGFPPDEIDEDAFTVVCSDIHFECRSMLEALRILLYKDCLNYVRYNCMPVLSNHFRILERLVVKMLKSFVTKRLPSLALILFRALFLAQKDLFFPIDIGKYYELVLCNSFITCKSSCAPHDGANLFILVHRSCRRGEVFRSTTYRSLVVELVRVKAPDDILRRILQLCLHYRVYPAFTNSPITLGTHLLLEEMYIYLLHCFQYLFEQDRPSFLQRTCTVKLVPTPKPLRKPCPFLEDLKKVKTEISYAAERFEEALRRIVGPVIYNDLSLNFSSPSEIVIPSVGMEAVAGTLLGDRY